MNISLNHILSRIDIRRLSGVRSVLGIEFAGDKVHVAELRRRGNPFDLLSGEITASESFTIDFLKSSPAETGRTLRSALDRHGVKTRFAVMGVRSSSVRTVSATIPTEVDNFAEWIVEHSPGLLKLPVAPSDVCYFVTDAERGSAGTSVKIAFLRKSERDEYQIVASEAGFELMALADANAELSRLYQLS